MREHETFVCVCNKEQLTIIDDGIATQISVKYVRLKLSLRLQEFWRGIVGLPPIPYCLVFVGTERKRLMEFLECVRFPMQHGVRVPTLYNTFTKIPMDFRETQLPNSVVIKKIPLKKKIPSKKKPA